MNSYKNKSSRWLTSLKKNFKLFTSQLSSLEIERLIKSDAPNIYQFYARDMDRPSGKKNWIIKVPIFFKNLFKAFISKMSPLRRLIYLIGALIFIEGLLSGRVLYTLGGFFIINILLAFELADKLTAKDELEVARKIQLDLMPKKAPFHARFTIVFFNETAHEVGGDFYEFLRIGDDAQSITVVIGDISGKGMAAALHMVQIHTIIHGLKNISNLKSCLTELNTRIKSLLPAKQFVTITLTELASDGCVKFCRAGHLPLIYYSPAQNDYREVTPKGIGIGLAKSPEFEKLLEEFTIQTIPGDVLVLYTDGLVETMNDQKREFGESRLKEIVIQNASSSGQEIEAAILKAVARFRGTAPPFDDLTLIVIKVV